MNETAEYSAGWSGFGFGFSGRWKVNNMRMGVLNNIVSRFQDNLFGIFSQSKFLSDRFCDSYPKNCRFGVNRLNGKAQTRAKGKKTNYPILFKIILITYSDV
jgi:hypothetical protein